MIAPRLRLELADEEQLGLHRELVIDRQFGVFQGGSSWNTRDQSAILSRSAGWYARTRIEFASIATDPGTSNEKQSSSARATERSNSTYSGPRPWTLATGLLDSYQA